MAKSIGNRENILKSTVWKLLDFQPLSSYDE